MTTTKTDPARKLIADKLKLNPSKMKFDPKREEAYVVHPELPRGATKTVFRKVYLSEFQTDWVDASHWAEMHQWQSDALLLHVYDTRGPAAAMLHKLTVG